MGCGSFVMGACEGGQGGGWRELGVKWGEVGWFE